MPQGSRQWNSTCLLLAILSSMHFSYLWAFPVPVMLLNLDLDKFENLVGHLGMLYQESISTNQGKDTANIVSVEYNKERS